jgi:DNA-binding NtrC family response regulator
MNQILIIEDEEVIRRAVSRLLQRRGYQVAAAGSLEDAESNHNLGDFDLIIADLRLPGLPGTEVIRRTQGVPVLIMTSYASVRSAVEAMKLGAIDYIAKPFDHDEMVLLVERILKQGRLERQNQALKTDLERTYPVEGMVGNCPAMQDICRRIGKVAPTDSTVLVLGESGTGKELVARALHQHSHRRNAPFVTVNCAAIPDTLIESELFGHEKGAFPGAEGTAPGLVESADGGTLFLDEIGDLPLPSQARLLRVLQDGEVRRIGSEHSRHLDLRLIAATNRDLKTLVQDGKFRSDLYFRLRVMEFELPPLRERGDDLLELALFLLEKAYRQINKPPLSLPQETLKAISRYHWPGNVRELENAMQRAAILADSDGVITPDLLAIETTADAPTPQQRTGELSLEAYFRRFVLEHQEQLTETELAKRLGISRKALWERRQRLGIPRRKNPNGPQD